MPITLLDGILVGFTLVSAILAMVRGLSREVLSIASWAAAAIAAYFFYPAVVPYVEPYIDNKLVQTLAAAAAVFFVALIVVTVITMRIADFIIDSRIGALDRTLGFLYGAARGILVVAVGLLFFKGLSGDNMPGWIAEAKSRPLLEGIGDRLEALLPADLENSVVKKYLPEGVGGGEQQAAPEGGEAAAPEGEEAAAPEGGKPPAEGTTNNN